jgi:hypothetical protein
LADVLVVAAHQGLDEAYKHLQEIVLQAERGDYVYRSGHQKDGPRCAPDQRPKDRRLCRCGETVK